ncbi:MAG: hypothetical protein JW966_03710 [Anaerolineae bacterium]|nr:hypothetical protein [Anaerolineae bacterium]
MMNTWTLAHYLTDFALSFTNPVFARERRRISDRLISVPPLNPWLVFVIGWAAAALLLALNLLLILVAVLAIWTLLAGLMLSRTVATERQAGTWDMLRLTPLHLDTILIGKASAALWPLRYLLIVVRGLLVLAAVGVGVISLRFVPDILFTQSVWLPLICVVPLGMAVLGAAVFLFDRVQQLVLIALAALAASAASPSGRVAMVGAAAVVFVVWLLDICVAMIVLVVLPVRTTTTIGSDVIGLAALGSTAHYLRVLPFGQAALAVGVTLAAREITVRTLWRWTLHAARS